MIIAYSINFINVHYQILLVPLFKLSRYDTVEVIYMTFQFNVTQEVLDLGVKVKAVVIEGIDNTTISPEYLAYRKEAIQQLQKKYEGINAKQEPIVQGFYTLHDQVGVRRRKNPPASETLIKLLQKRNDLPSINKLVDIYNIISTDTELALGAHDIDKIDGNVTLRIQDGTERFIPLGSNEPQPVKAGEYSYIDDSSEIICHLEIRQVNKTLVDENSKNIYFIIQGNEVTPSSLLDETAQKLIDRVTQFCGGQGQIIY